MMKSKILTAPNADAKQLALILVVTFIPPATWLACGAFAASCKRYMMRMVRKDGDIDKTPTEDRKPAQAVMSYLFHLIFEILMISLQTFMGVVRSVLQYTPLIVLLVLSILWSILMLNHGRELINMVDVMYETLRPNIIETVLQILNMARVLYAIFVGVWNAYLQVIKVPVRLLSDAGFQCGGVVLLQRVAVDSARILRDSADVLAYFFMGFANDNVLDVDLTKLIFSVRHLMMAFVETIECSCETFVGPVSRTLVAPLYMNETDVFVSNATRAGLKLVEIPWLVVSTGATSFEPFFEMMLSEDNGVLAAGAKVLNLHLTEVIDFVQQDVPGWLRFGTPPIFSIAHRGRAWCSRRRERSS